MARKKINKVVYGGVVLIDLTSDTITAADVMDGVRFHLPNGEVALGTYVPPAGTNGAGGATQGAAASAAAGNESGE